MISAITNFLGAYTQLNGDGIASINWPWILGAVLLVITIWFLYKIILVVFKGLLHV